jgi:twitching motility protein PilT
MIMDPEQTGELTQVISEGAYYGRQTFDQALLAHVQAGLVSMETALRVASHPHDFKLLVASGGERSTSVEQVLRSAPDVSGAPAPAVGSAT